jgi:Ca2+-binding RTX toxin-like protein
MPLNLIFTQPGNFTIEDNGIPGDNTSVIKDGSGTVIFTFIHPVDSLGFTVSVPGVNLTINITDSLGAADFTVGNLTNSAATPDSITIRNVSTTGAVTLVSNGFIREGGSDVAADIVAGSLIMSAGTGVGTGANAIETQTGVIEAETTTGGITLVNFGSVQIGGLSADVDGLDVATSGAISFTAYGSIFLGDDTSFESIHGGSTSGNVTLNAIGYSSDIIANVDNDAISAPGGSIFLTAGRDIAFGTIGANFDNDVRAKASIVVNAGRDFLIDGFADMVSDDFGAGSGGNLTITAGRNIHALNVAGSDATILANGNAGGNLNLTTGAGGSVILDAPTTNALQSLSGKVTINADRLLISASSGITANAGQVNLRAVTEGREIHLGSATDAAFALEISDAELDRIFAPTLTIGTATAGSIVANGPLTPANVQNLTLTSGTDVLLNSGLTVLQNLILRAGDNLILGSGSTVTANSVNAFVDIVPQGGGIGGIGLFLGALSGATVALDGGDKNDTLQGAQGIDQIVHGNGGHDVIISSGEGHYFGDDGNDTIHGGLSTGLVPEVLDGGAGTDTLDTTSYTGDYTISMAPGVTNFAYESFVNFENLIAGTGNDTLYGTGAANNIQAGGGNDYVSGAGGNDTLSGGDGDDTLLGRTGNDTLDGGIGNDELDGGEGKDTMTGGAGSDGFTFRDGETGPLRGNADIVTDFTQGEDILRLNPIDAKVSVGGNQAFTFIGTTAFSGTEGELRYTHLNGKTYVEADTDGDAVANYQINLTGLINLTAADFVL